MRQSLAICAVLTSLSLSIIHVQELDAQPLRFSRENIEMNVHGDYCVLNGIYYFKNEGKTALRQILFYPFVISNDLPYPDSISVRETSTNHEVAYSRSVEGISFGISVPAQSFSVYRVTYRQRTPSGYMEYILTTTADWKKPLEIAEYQIRMPRTLALEYLSLPGVSSTKRGDESIYYVRKATYMPSANIVVRWTEGSL